MDDLENITHGTASNWGRKRIRDDGRQTRYVLSSYQRMIITSDSQQAEVYWGCNAIPLWRRYCNGDSALHTKHFAPVRISYQRQKN